ncbi:MAG: metallophosphoesterase family protein [Clostridiales bacterium]|nr:metallophosphoesterase family protein [Clostridiales bacterium]
MSDVQLKFNENGQFKILVAADLHMLEPNSAKGFDTVRLLEAAVEELRPDLAVFLGDNVTMWDAITEESVRDAIDAIVTPIAQKGIPLAVVFGNHECETPLGNAGQLEHFQTYSKCLAVKGEPETGVGNYNLVIKSHDGSHDRFNLWFIDSGSSIINPDGSESYDYVRENQLRWYEQTAEKLRSTNHGYNLPAIVFQHMTVPEEYELLREVPALTPFAVKGHGSRSDKYYVIAQPRFTKGELAEGPCPPDFNSGEFECWKRQGDVIGAVFGHDHVNDFDGTVDGIRLVQARGSGFQGYGDGDSRAVTLITLDESDLGTFDSEGFFFRELVGKSVSMPGAKALTRKEKTAIGIGGGSAAVVAAAGFGAIISKIIKRKKK